MTTGEISIVVLGDDAMRVRELAGEIETAEGLTVIGHATDLQSAVRMVESRTPRVVLLLVRGPEWIEVVQEVRASLPRPIVALCRTAELGLAALSAGALEWLDYSAEARRVVESVRLMADVTVVRRRRVPARTERQALPSESAVRADPEPALAHRIVAIGGSTGAPVVAVEILRQLRPPCRATILLVQHMPHDYGASFVHWLAENVPLEVRLAADGDRLRPGVVYVAPANAHLVVRRGARLGLEPVEGSEAAPSADRLFSSLARLQGWDRCGVLLTGMGRDGARGLRELRDSDGRTMAQDEESCAVYGMPAAAVELDAAESVLPPDRIALRLRAWVDRD